MAIGLHCSWDTKDYAGQDISTSLFHLLFMMIISATNSSTWLMSLVDIPFLCKARSNQVQQYKTNTSDKQTYKQNDKIN